MCIGHLRSQPSEECEEMFELDVGPRQQELRDAFESASESTRRTLDIGDTLPGFSKDGEMYCLVTSTVASGGIGQTFECWANAATQCGIRVSASDPLDSLDEVIGTVVRSAIGKTLMFGLSREEAESILSHGADLNDKVRRSFGSSFRLGLSGLLTCQTFAAQPMMFMDVTGHMAALGVIRGEPMLNVKLAECGAYGLLYPMHVDTKLENALYVLPVTIFARWEGSAQIVDDFGLNHWVSCFGLGFGLALGLKTPSDNLILVYRSARSG